VRDPLAVEHACSMLGLAAPTEGEAKVYATTKRGLVVWREGWEFPICCDREAVS
jgi:hypothetical protein